MPNFVARRLVGGACRVGATLVVLVALSCGNQATNLHGGAEAAPGQTGSASITSTR